MLINASIYNTGYNVEDKMFFLKYNNIQDKS